MHTTFPHLKASGAVSSKQKGFSLVVVLSLLTITLILVLAFFSQATLSRKTASLSAANEKAYYLSRMGLENIIHDFRTEMTAGSGSNAPGIYSPILVSTTNQLLGANITLSTAPSLAPQRMVRNPAQAPLTLLKQSINEQPFFNTQTGYSSNFTALSRAANVNTTNQNRSGRFISPQRWRSPQFAAASETITSPDWIYLNRNGENPKNFSTNWAARTPENSNYIIGRYAYNVYDVSGLIDINLIGNSLDAAENRHRGRLHQASLESMSSTVRPVDFVAFLNWRSPNNNDASTNSGGLFDPRRNFSETRPDQQSLVTRKELIAYAQRPNSPLSLSGLPFLTVFSPSLNTPSYSPEPNRPKLPAAPPPDIINPDLNSLRFSTSTELQRGSNETLIVPAGTPVMPRRFPLSKIQLLSEVNPDPISLTYYFGLEKLADGTFRYVAHSNDRRIKNLSEVLAENREPNFFEVLLATITTGSLARDAGNTYTINQPYDLNRYYQVIQIGANIIDQWDSDNYPTAIAFPLGNPNEFYTQYGIENLPYLNNIVFVGYRPETDRSRFQLWALFDVWNPHSNANILPSGIDAFRILPSGKATTDLRFSALSRPSGISSDVVYNAFANATSRGNILQDIGAANGGLNQGRNFTFPNADYSIPTIIGGQKPDAGGADWREYQGGLLINDYANIPDAVPALPPVGDARRPFMDAALSHFGQPPLPPNGAGQWGPKAHNYFRVRSGPLEDEKMQFRLQYRKSPSGQWITYQTSRAILPALGEGSLPYVRGNDLDGLQDGSEIVTQTRPFTSLAELQKNTSSTGPMLETDICFYDWRNASVRPYSVNLSKFDPRTTRFGFNGNSSDPLGKTINQSILPYAGSVDNTQFNWRNWFSYFVVGQETSIGVFGNKGFSWFQAPSSRQIGAFALIQNIPDGVVSSPTNPGRYADRDGIVRPADGYFGAKPAANPISASGIGSREDRPIILNRPFKTVGELGLVFRDIPWKSLDFATKNSGDLGLLDVFSINESETELPVKYGAINLNAAPKEVLSALLTGSGKNFSPNGPLLSKGEADTIADAILAERSKGWFRSRGDLVARVFTPAGLNTLGPIADRQKLYRETATRSLAEIGETRNWNFFVDLIVQSGKFGPSASGASDFEVESEQRYWIHIALDRFTGQLIDQKWERVHE